MVQKTHMNVLDTIAGNAGISFATTNSFNNNPLSVAAHAQGAMGNMAKIGTIVDQIAKQQEPSPHGAGGVGPGGGSFLRTALTTGALAIGMVVLPQVAAFAGAALSVGESTHFGLKGNAGKGEMTLAHDDAATAFENGVYVSAFDGQSTDIMTGRTVAKPAAMGQAAGPPTKGMHNLGAIAAEATAGMDHEQIQKDVLAKFRDQQADFGRDMRRLREMGAMENNGPHMSNIENNVAELGEAVKNVLKPAAAGFIPRALGLG